MIRSTRQLISCIAVMGFAMLISSSRADDPWVVYEGKEGPGVGKHIVLVTGDDEYRSEEAMPALAKILAIHHGFKCSVLFAIDPSDGTIKPDHQTNIPGTHLLNNADMMVLFTRFRQLPDEQMKPIMDFVGSGKPILGLRTATHAFNYGPESNSPYAKYTWRSKDPEGGFGQLVFGETWVSHHGHHGKESTRGIINEKYGDHPLLTGVDDLWGPTDVYGVIHLPKDTQVLVYGQVLAGMEPSSPPVKGEKNDPMTPLIWTRDYLGEKGNTSKVICTTMGSSQDLESEGFRRLLVNTCYWGLGLTEQIPSKAAVPFVGEYAPTTFGFNAFQVGITPDDHRLP